MSEGGYVRQSLTSAAGQVGPQHCYPINQYVKLLTCNHTIWSSTYPTMPSSTLPSIDRYGVCNRLLRYTTNGSYFSDGLGDVGGGVGLVIGLA